MEAQAKVGTVFTYQRQLKQNGIPVKGKCALRFSLCDAERRGNEGFTAGGQILLGESSVGDTGSVS